MINSSNQLLSPLVRGCPYEASVSRRCGPFERNPNSVSFRVGQAINDSSVDVELMNEILKAE